MFAIAAPAQAERDPERELAPARTLSGAFLAAETARTGNDFGAAVKYYRDALRFDPENQGLQRELLISLITNGQFADALPHAEALKNVPEVERISRVALGIQALRDRRFLQADSMLILALENDLERLLTGIMRAWAKLGAGETDNALADIDALEGPDWYELFATYHGALIADAAGREAEAAQRYEAGISNSTGGSASPQTYLRLAEAYAGFLAREGKPEEALEAIDFGLGLAPSNPSLLAVQADIENAAGKALRVASPAKGAAEILYNLGTAINRDGAEGFAALYFEFARALDPENAAINFELGGISERLSSPERAISYYDGISPKSPYGRIARLQKGLNLSDMDRNEEAKQTLLAAIDDNPQEYRGYLALGGVYAGLKEYAEAAELYERAVRHFDNSDPTYWPLYYRMGIAYERIKQWDKAERAFKHALKLSPNQADVLNYLGYSWIDMNINLNEGLEMIRKAVDMRPRDGYIVDSLGWAFYRLGRFEEAVTELEKATELRPRDAIINDHLGDAYWRVGRKLEATYQWAQALDMEIEPEEATKIEAKLQASNTPGERPQIAVSRIDEAVSGKTAASPDTDSDG